MRLLHVSCFLSLLLALCSCSQKTILVHPGTGAKSECSVSSYGLLGAGMPTMMEVCLEDAEKKGYVSVEKLTPEQRADLERRGLLPN
jgi:hypothetical protein